jgi:UDP-N-acetylglucosamine 2-epimerase (non-hydrolysing)
MTKLLTMLGTRPEIIKLSPLIPLLQTQFEHVLVHSGQHYSYEMDAQFFEELELPAPAYTLNVGSAPHGEQTARMLARLEPIMLDEQPDLVVVQGDTNTTLAGALVAAKQNIQVAHIEAGCRSFNRAMPEELNRVLVDHMATLRLAPDQRALDHLRAEGLDGLLVGSTAIDACERSRGVLWRSRILETLELVPGAYLALTLHRAENTDPAVLPGIVAALAALAKQHVIVCPLHPRTRAALAAQGQTLPPQLRVCPPLGYIDTLRLVADARALLTDSGGLQEEAAVLGTPALVLRRETEWQELVDSGFHTLASNTPQSILAAAAQVLRPDYLASLRAQPPRMHGGASERIVAALTNYLHATEGTRQPRVALPAGSR